MKLKPFVISDRVVLGLKPGNQREILQQLIAPMVSAGNLLHDPEEFLDDLLIREQEVTTVMENGVVFPHARSKAVKRLCLTIGIANGESALEFNSEVGAESRLFFCIGVPAFAPTAHIPILQALASFARDEKRVSKLLECKTPSSVVKRLAPFKG